MKLLLTGGGTGGHIYPALAIAEMLREDPRTQPFTVQFVGTKDRLEATLVPDAGLPIAFVRSRPLVRKISLAFFATLVQNAIGVVQACGTIARLRPDCAIATGGYVAFPVVIATRLLRAFGIVHARIALVEPNARAGLTNRILAPLVDEIWYGYAGLGEASDKTFVTGTPVRSSFLYAVSKAEARRALGLDPERTTIFVMGGSQGAQRLNQAVAELLSEGLLPADRQLVHLTGPSVGAAAELEPELAARVVTRPYLHDPRVAYAAADVIVARAGASTLAEIAATGTPSLLVPYPHASGDHQTHNAAVFVRAGAARLVPDAELDGRRLSEELQAVLDPPALAAMREAAERLAPRDLRGTIVTRALALAGRG
jgi:UDP-N-acetylglucosamine--N-acetylmuramyl-(pentapeptide) pyrophosphoryl-undecaprenol N-acetylglucosamine transferase